VLTALAAELIRPPQYAPNPAAGGPGAFFFIDNLFGQQQPSPAPGVDMGPQSGTFRLSRATCDGAYFPVSFATYQARFQMTRRPQGLCRQRRRRCSPIAIRRDIIQAVLDQRSALFVAAQRFKFAPS